MEIPDEPTNAVRRESIAPEPSLYVQCVAQSSATGYDGPSVCDLQKMINGARDTKTKVIARELKQLKRWELIKLSRARTATKQIDRRHRQLTGALCQLSDSLHQLQRMRSGDSLIFENMIPHWIVEECEDFAQLN